MASILTVVLIFIVLVLVGFALTGIVNIFFWLLGLVYQGIEKLFKTLINKDSN